MAEASETGITKRFAKWWRMTQAELGAALVVSLFLCALWCCQHHAHATAMFTPFPALSIPPTLALGLAYFRT
jgi:hypothetical protein